MPEFLTRTGEPSGVTTLEQCNSQIVVHFHSSADFSLGDIEVGHSMGEILLKEVKTAHLMAIGRQLGHFSSQQPISNAGIFRATTSLENRDVWLVGHA